MDLTLRCKDLHPWESKKELQKLTFPEYILNKTLEHAAVLDVPFSIDAETGEEIYFSKYEPLSRNVACWFFSKGMKKEDVVLYMVRKMTKLTLFQTGVWRGNGIVRASYPQDLPDDIAERLIESQVKWIYAEPEDVHKCFQAREKCPWEVTIIVNGHAEGCVSIDELLSFRGPVPLLDIKPMDIAIILQTSGTTGKAKGAIRTHKALMCLIISGSMKGITDKFVSILAATHIGAVLFLYSSIALGVTHIPLHISEPEFVLRTLNKYKPTMIFGFPGYWVNAIASPSRKNYDLSSINYVATGGVVITPAMKQELEKFENVSNTIVFYGATETLLPVGHTWFLDKITLIVEDIQGSEIGRVRPGAQLQILDLQTGLPLGPNQKGEICVKSLDMITEYLNNPQKTAEAFTADGFCKMGDLGSYDEDGVVSIFGRIKEVFKYYNNHIPPDHIDSIIGEHPAVLEACTIGITTSDGNMIPRTFVALKQGSVIAPADITDFAHAKLPEYMHISGGLYIVDTLPRGASGKISRAVISELQDQLMSQVRKS